MLPVAMVNMKLMETYLSSITKKMAINVSVCLEKYFTIRLHSSNEYVKASHLDEIGVYYRTFDLGLRFPLDIIIANILNAYNIALFQLKPITFGCIVGFVVLCKRYGIDPSNYPVQIILLPQGIGGHDLVFVHVRLGDYFLGLLAL